MSQDNMQLNHANGTTFLNFWDSIHGNDAVFKITPEQVYRMEWNEEEDDMMPVPVNLNEELIKLSIKMQEGVR